MRVVGRTARSLLLVFLHEPERAELGYFSMGVMSAGPLPEALVRDLRTRPAGELVQIAEAVGCRAWRNPEPTCTAKSANAEAEDAVGQGAYADP